MASLVASSADAGDGIPTEVFSIDLQGGKTAIGHVMILDQSCYIWLGNDNAEPSMSALATAIPTRFEAIPVSTTLMSNEEDDIGSEIAQKLAQRFKIQVFVSCNFSTPLLDKQRQDIDKRLVELLMGYFPKE